MSEAFSPAGISSFFEICNVDANGTPLTDPTQIGARGGGFALTHGVKARVTTTNSDRTQIEIRINSKISPDAHTTRWALERLLEEAQASKNVRVDIRVDVPIAAGYGSSAAGTAAACLALADAAELSVTYNELGKITHAAEVVNGTGLGTASAVFVGGFILVTEPGAPGIGSVDRLLFPKDHSIVCAFLESMPTREALDQTDLSGRVNPIARRTMEKIRKKPDLYTFLTACREFGQEAGFESEDITELIDIMNSEGAIGAAQNMIGKAVHGVAKTKKAPQVARIVRRRFPKAVVFVSQLDEKSVRLTTGRKPKH